MKTPRPRSRKLIKLDLTVQRDPAAPPAEDRGGGVATLKPVTIPLKIEGPRRQRYLKILRRP